MYTKVVCPGCEKDYTEEANRTWGYTSLDGTWGCDDCGEAFIISDWLSQNSTVEEGEKELPKSLRHTCPYCFHPLDATHFTALYECPKCLNNFSNTKSAESIKAELERLQAENEKLRSAIEHARDNNPYPPDVFSSDIGRAAACGYHACLHNVDEFLKQSRERLGEGE